MTIYKKIKTMEQGDKNKMINCCQQVVGRQGRYELTGEE